MKNESRTEDRRTLPPSRDQARDLETFERELASLGEFRASVRNIGRTMEII